jgi:hypothetical protein
MKLGEEPLNTSHKPDHAIILEVRVQQKVPNLNQLPRLLLTFQNNTFIVQIPDLSRDLENHKNLFSKLKIQITTIQQ